MPEMGAQIFLQAMRAEARFATIPVVVMLGGGMAEDTRRQLSASVQHFVLKSADTWNDLDAAIQAVLGEAAPESVAA